MRSRGGDGIIRSHDTMQNAKPLKIVIFTQNLGIGGIARLVVDEANELHRRGHEVYVLICEQTPSDMAHELDSVNFLSAINLDYSRMRHVGGFFGTLLVLRMIRPDAIVTHHWFANTIGRIAGMVLRVPTVAFEHSTQDHKKGRKQRFIDRLLQHVCVKVIAVSGSVRDSLLRVGIRAERIAVVPNGVDLSRFRKTSGTGVFVFVGRLIRLKGVDVLLRALASVETVRLRVVGDGEERGKLEQLAHDLGIADRVQFDGATLATPSILSDASALVLPSRGDAFALVIIEALASEVPVIVSDFPGVRDLVKHEVNGLVVPVDDVPALAAALRSMNDPATRARFTEKTRAGLERYSIQSHVDQLLSQFV